jgi:CheY-like chemotaxis protein
VKRLILLADDSPTIQRLVTQMFTGGEFDVLAVSNGDAAVRKFEELHPDLILADIYMPGKNGYEVCAAVKKHPELGDTPVVLLAGAFDAFDEETASQVGAAAHITKPFEPNALVSLVASLASKEGRPRTVAAPGPAPAPAREPAPIAQVAPVAAITASAAAPSTVPAAPLTLEVAPLALEVAKLTLETATTAPAAVVSEQPKASSVDAEEVPVAAPVLVSAPAPTIKEPPKDESPEAIKPVTAESRATPADSSDLLGLQDLFKPQPPASVSDAEIERIAQLVIQKLSTQVIENVAWDVVPDITTKVLKEELKRRS